jgi:hypothetical protein
MAIVSLKKNKNVLVAARISTDIMDILKANNVNVSKTIREYLISVVYDLRASRKSRKVS